jgi:hypothetical protein
VHYADKIVNFILVQKTLRGTLKRPPRVLPCWLIRYFFFLAFFAGAFLAAFLVVAICLFSLSDGLQ